MKKEVVEKVSKRMFEMLYGRFQDFEFKVRILKNKNCLKVKIGCNCEATIDVVKKMIGLGVTRVDIICTKKQKVILFYLRDNEGTIAVGTSFKTHNALPQWKLSFGRQGFKSNDGFYLQETQHKYITDTKGFKVRKIKNNNDSISKYKLCKFIERIITPKRNKEQMTHEEFVKFQSILKSRNTIA